MGSRNAEHEAFIHRLLGEIAVLQETSDSDCTALVDALNARGMVSRRGRPWTAVTLEKFLSSPGAKRLQKTKRLRS